MDSKGKKIGILFVLCSILAVMTAVVLVNYNQLMGKNSNPASGSNTDSVSHQIIEADGRVHGADLSAFMKDSDFFDAEVPNGSNQSTYDEVDENGESVRRLTVLASSVERDIRVKIVDDKGDVVSGEKFAVAVEDTGVYIDDDKDGVILISDIKPGEYKVSLNDQPGFKVPASPVNVRVKSIVSYTVIDDIDLFVHEESEVDILKEDTKDKKIDSEDEDDSQHTALLDMEKDERENAVKLGIDVSKWNGEIDWEIVKAEGVDFAIIRCGYRGSSSGWLIEDPYFYKNLTGAKKAGVKVGLYFFTQAINPVEAVEEASMVVSLLGETEIDYPVYIDIEGAGGNGRADDLDAAARTAIANAFCRTIRNAGLDAGVYSSRYWYYNNLLVDEMDSLKIWLAEYRDTPLYTGRYDMWQYTSSGSVAGIKGRVDLNVSYLGIE
ncbi:MAG: glycoside hydrolase family 25 protein [Lachnospiraceae bacterium]|nr:glycoside hydrolase family 25 protein [Lachnospiraceae bacterium]MDE7205509.1 glycoside hydrolase family 25 protein [Lachnospiraceae bacterium]